MAKGGYAPVNGLELFYEIHGEGGYFHPEEVTAAIGVLLGARSRP